MIEQREKAERADAPYGRLNRSYERCLCINRRGKSICRARLSSENWLQIDCLVRTKTCAGKEKRRERGKRICQLLLRSACRMHAKQKEKLSPREWQYSRSKSWTREWIGRKFLPSKGFWTTKCQHGGGALMSCTPSPKAAKPVWAKPLTQLLCLVIFSYATCQIDSHL